MSIQKFTTPEFDLEPQESLEKARGATGALNVDVIVRVEYPDALL